MNFSTTFKYIEMHLYMTLIILSPAVDFLIPVQPYKHQELAWDQYEDLCESGDSEESSDSTAAHSRWETHKNWYDNIDRYVYYKYDLLMFYFCVSLQSWRGCSSMQVHYTHLYSDNRSFITALQSD